MTARTCFLTISAKPAISLWFALHSCKKTWAGWNFANVRRESLLEVKLWDEPEGFCGCWILNKIGRKEKLAGQERYGPACHRGEKARMHFIRFLAIYNIATPVTFSINALNLERGNCISKQITICSTLAKHSSHKHSWKKSGNLGTRFLVHFRPKFGK